MIHVVIPAAGTGSRFAEAGYAEPKPLVPVLGKPMIQQVIDNLRPAYADRPHRITVLSQVPLPGIDADVQIIEPTRGAVETILQADLDGPLLIANCDQLVQSDWLPPLTRDGWLMTFRSGKPHHSYVATDAGGVITRIAEKEVISRRAVAGVYAFADGNRFRSAAERVLAEDRRVLGEFYVSTVIDELISDGAELGTVDCRCAVLGTPEELDLFLAAAAVALRPGPVRRLEIGCGDTPTEGWEHLDVRDLPGVQHVQSAVSLRKFDDNVFDEIVAKDIVEHLAWRDVPVALAEWVRVLKPGGTLDVETPNAEELVQLVQDPAGHLRRWGSESDWQRFCRVMFGHQDYPANFHASYFTPQWLTELLDQAGAAKVEEIHRDLYRFRLRAAK